MAIKDSMRGGGNAGRGDNPHTPRLAPSGDMGTPELSTLVKSANPTPAGVAAPMGTSKVYNAPTSQRGYSGSAAYAVPNENMAGIKDHYRDLRTGTNNSGKNPENQTMGRSNARQASIVGANGQQNMIQDAYGKPTPRVGGY